MPIINADTYGLKIDTTGLEVGHNEHRLTNEEYNALEVKYVKRMNKLLKQNPQFLDQIVSRKRGDDIDYLNDEERKIVMSVIQWLGTPVGQSFVKGEM